MLTLSSCSESPTDADAASFAGAPSRCRAAWEVPSPPAPMVLSKGLAGWCLQDWEVAASLRRVYAARNGARVAIQRPRLVSHGLLRSWNTSNGEAHGSPRRCSGGHSSTYRITATPEVQPVVVILKRKIDLGALKVVTPPWHAVCRTRLCAAAVPKLSETTGYSQLFAAAAFPSRFDFCRGDAGWLNSAEMSAPRYVIKITMIFFLRDIFIRPRNDPGTLGAVVFLATQVPPPPAESKSPCFAARSGPRGSIVPPSSRHSMLSWSKNVSLAHAIASRHLRQQRRQLEHSERWRAAQPGMEPFLLEVDTRFGEM